jgi:hypothetical protein
LLPRVLCWPLLLPVMLLWLCWPPRQLILRLL